MNMYKIVERIEALEEHNVLINDQLQELEPRINNLQSQIDELETGLQSQINVLGVDLQRQIGELEERIWNNEQHTYFLEDKTEWMSSHPEVHIVIAMVPFLAGTQNHFDPACCD